MAWAIRFWGFSVLMDIDIATQKTWPRQDTAINCSEWYDFLGHAEKQTFIEKQTCLDSNWKVDMLRNLSESMFCTLQSTNMCT